MRGQGAGAQIRREKKALRREIAGRRRVLPAGIAEAFSAVALSRLRSCPEYGEAGTVMAFASFRDELRTLPLLRAVIDDGKRLVLPATLTETRSLDLRIAKDLDQLGPGPWGILEPQRGYEVATPADLDLVIVPGLAFDPAGKRLGYGGGYYDGLLGELADLSDGRERISCGLAYEVQYVAQVPAGYWDQPVDMLVTEQAVRRFRPCHAAGSTTRSGGRGV